MSEGPLLPFKVEPMPPVQRKMNEHGRANPKLFEELAGEWLRVESELTWNPLDWGELKFHKVRGRLRHAYCVGGSKHFTIGFLVYFEARQVYIAEYTPRSAT